MALIDGIRFQPLKPEWKMPLVAESASGSVDLVAWARANRQSLEDKLDAHGAILFRGFDVAEPETFQEFSGAAARLVDYVYRSTPRTQVGSKVYTSTEYPADSTIPMHCENAYKEDWPTKLFFYCAQPAEQGGETPLGDVVEVTKRIPPEILEIFAQNNVMYVRNYGGGVDLTWQTVFQTQERGEVEQFCREHDIELEWYGRDRLRTRQVCQGVAVHPRTGDRVWFNQAHLFHVSSLDEKTRKALLSLFKEDELPRNAYFGDGSSIDPAMLDEIREAFTAHTIAFPWQGADVLAVDNMLVAHGRKPFSGKRRVLVSMGDLYSQAIGS